MVEPDRPEDGEQRPKAHPRSPAWRRLFRLAAVATSTGFAARKFRSLQISGGVLAVSGVASVVLVASLSAADVADIVALRVMAYACWLFGGLGLWTLLNPAALEEEPSNLARLRGQRMDQPWVRLLAFAQRLGWGMCLASFPGLLAALFVSGDTSTALQRAGLLVVAFIYLASLSVLLGAVGALATAAAPRAPRSFAVALVLAPFALSFLNHQIPSIPGVYVWALGQMIEWGGLVS